MKKQYQTPTTQVCRIEQRQLLCASPEGDLGNPQAPEVDEWN
jgi:hypothetical protein